MPNESKMLTFTECVEARAKDAEENAKDLAEALEYLKANPGLEKVLKYWGSITIGSFQ